MKLSTFLILLSVMTVFADNSYSQTKLLSLDMKSSTVKEVLRNIEEESEYVFMYSEKIVDVTREVSVNIKNEEINVILDKLFAGTNVNYEVKDRFILLSTTQVSGSNLVSQQASTVTGRITDSSGEPLPGVTVLVKGTMQGAVTDFDGNYSISNVPTAGTLVFSFVGMRSQEVAVGNQATINVMMEEDAIGIDEVVAIGYGTIKRSNLTSAVSKVTGDKLENRTVANLSQALAGQMSGVRVQQSSAVPGETPEIYIRGLGSLNGDNQPLYVLDGFPVEDPLVINSLDFGNVESVEVLKDAASTSIYGARGANGIILITTKKGKEGKTSFNIKVNTGMQNALKKLDLLNAREDMEFERDARQNRWLDTGGHPNATNDERPGTNYDLDPNWYNEQWLDSIPNYDVQDWLFEPGIIQDYKLSVNGGSSSTRFSISGGYFNQDGITRNSGYERFSLRASVDTKVKEFLEVGVNLAPSYAVSDNADLHGKDSKFSNVVITSRSPNPIVDYVDGSIWGGGNSKWADRLTYMKDLRKQAAFSGSTYLQVNILNGLSFKTMLGSSFSNERRDQFEPIQVTQTTNPLGRAWNTTRTKWQTDNLLTYNREFAEKHTFSVLVGQSAYKINTYRIYLLGLDFPNSLSYTLNNAASIDNSSYTLESENSMASYFSRFSYDYLDKYMVSTSLRRDGSSRFGSDSKWGMFPSVSAGWNIAKESFISEFTDKINILKIRASWGKSGNNGIPDYREYPLLVSSNALFGTSEELNPGMANANIANPDLRWEKTASTNIGLDIGIYRNRVQLSTEYFINRTEDLLMGVPISATAGFSTSLQNYGSVENKGWEFDISTRNFDKKFIWNTNLNLSFLENKVLQLGPDDAPLENGSWYAPVHITKVGEPVGAFYMYDAIGVFNTQEEIDAYPSWRNTNPGDIIIRDANNDGEITTEDKIIAGQGLPKFFYGMTNMFSYRGFELSVLVSGVGGNKIYNAVSRQMNTGRSNANHYGHWRDRWRSPENPGDGVTPRANDAPTGANSQYTTRFLFDGDYWKIANVTLSYTFSPSVSKQIGMSLVKCFVTADNLYLKDNYPLGYNPEVSEQRGNPFTSGDDYQTYPMARTFSFGIELGF